MWKVAVKNDWKWTKMTQVSEFNKNYEKSRKTYRSSVNEVRPPPKFWGRLHLPKMTVKTRDFEINWKIHDFSCFPCHFWRSFTHSILSFCATHKNLKISAFLTKKWPRKLKSWNFQLISKSLVFTAIFGRCNLPQNFLGGRTSFTELR